MPLCLQSISAPRDRQQDRYTDILYIKVGKKDDLKPPAHVRVVVDHFSYRVDQLDDQLRHEVSRRGLASEDKHCAEQSPSPDFF